MIYGQDMPLKNFSKYGEFLALGIHIAATMVIPVVVGIYLDKRWNISPWGVIIGALTGFAATASIVIKLALKTGKSEYTHKKRPPS